MNEKYYNIEITTNSASKTYVVSATHELQARDRLFKELKLEYADIKNITVKEA